VAGLHLFTEPGIRIRIDAKHNYLAPLATHLYEIPPRLLHPDTLLNAIRSLGWQVEPEIPQLQVSERARQLITKRLLEWGIGPNDKLIIFHPFASTANRSLSPSKVKRILRSPYRAKLVGWADWFQEGKSGNSSKASQGPKLSR
jgi:hypothetical protein